MKPKTMSKFQNNLIVLIALASAAIALFAYYSFSNISIPEEKCEKVFLEWYRTLPNTYYDINKEAPYQAHQSSSSIPKEINLNIGKAFRNYEMRDYYLVKFEIDQVLNNKEIKEYPNVYFYYALSLLQMGESEQAITHLKYLSRLNDFHYSDEVKWYLALAHIRNCNAGKAKEQLHILSKEAKTTSYKEQADKLLVEL